MKKLHYSEATGLSLFIENDDNYTLGKEKNSTREVKGETVDTVALQSPSYFSSIGSALKRIATLEANTNCKESVASWIEEFNNSMDRFEALFGRCI